MSNKEKNKNLNEVLDSSELDEKNDQNSIKEDNNDTSIKQSEDIIEVVGDVEDSESQKEKTTDSKHTQNTEVVEDVEDVEDIEEVEVVEDSINTTDDESGGDIENIEDDLEADKKLSKKEKKKLKKEKKKKSKKNKKSTKEKIRSAKKNVKLGMISAKNTTKKVFRILVISVVVLVLGYLVLNLGLQTYFYGGQELDIITLYDESKIQGLLEDYGNNILSGSRAFYEVKDPEFYKSLVGKERQQINFSRRNKVILESKVYGIKDKDYYIGVVVRVQAPIVGPKNFMQFKNLFGKNEDIYYSLIEVDRDTQKVNKEYSVYIDSYDQRIIGKESRGISQDLASEYGLKQLEEKYSIKFSDIYQNLKYDNLVEELNNELVLDVLTKDSVTSSNKEITDREKELIQASLYKEVNNLGKNYGVSKAIESEVSEKIKSIIDSLKLPSKEFGYFYNLIKSGTFSEGAEVQFIPKANIWEKIKYILPFWANEAEVSYRGFLTKFQGAYLSDYEMYSNDEELYVFLNYRKDLNGTQITTTVFISFNKETGQMGYLNEKSSQLEFTLDEEESRDSKLQSKRDLLLSHVMSRVNLYKTDSIKEGNLSSYQLDFLNDKDFIKTIFSAESMEEVILRSEITSSSLSLEFTKEDIVQLMFLIENYENKKFQGELSEVLRDSGLGEMSKLKEFLFNEYDIMIIEKFDTEEYRSGFEIYDKTHIFGVELKNPSYIIAR